MKLRKFKASDIGKTLRVAVRDLCQSEHQTQDALFTVTEVTRGGIGGHFHQTRDHNARFNRDDIRVEVD